MKNKLILSLGVSLLAFAPVMTVVACGDDKPAEQTDLQKATAAINGITKSTHAFTNGTTVDQAAILSAWTLVNGTPAGVTWTVEDITTTGTLGATIKATVGTSSVTKAITFTFATVAPSATIDLNNIATPKALLAAINSELNVYMGIPASDLIKPENKAQFIAYTNQITANKVIRFTKGTDSIDLDFSAVQTEVNNIRRIVENDLHVSNVGKGSSIGMAMLNNNLMPPMAALTETMMGQIWSLTIAPYMELSELTYTNNIAAVVEQHSYVKMLFAYNVEFDKLVNSAAFKAWNVDKEYKLPKTLTNEDWVEFSIKSGKLYDAVSYPRLNGLKPGSTVSNLEAQFVYELLKCDAVVAASPTMITNPTTYFGKDAVKAALPEFTDAQFSDSTYSEKLVYAPNTNGMNTVKLTSNGWIYDESQYRLTMPSSTVFIYGEVSDSFGAYYFLKPTVDVYGNAPIFAKYPEFTSAYLTTSGTTAPEGWFKTTNPKDPAIATATVKFYSQSAKATFYRTTPLSPEYADIISIWEPLRMVPGSTQISTSLNVEAINELAANNGVFAPLTNEIINSWGIANFPQLPTDMKGVTVKYKFTTLNQGTVTQGTTTSTRRTVYLSLEASKGATTYTSTNQFRIASSSVPTDLETQDWSVISYKNYLTGVTWTDATTGTATSTTTVANKPQADIAEKTYVHTDLKAATNPILSSITATSAPAAVTGNTIKFSYAAATDTVTLKIQRAGIADVVLTIVVTYA